MIIRHGGCIHHATISAMDQKTIFEYRRMRPVFSQHFVRLAITNRTGDYIHFIHEKFTKTKRILIYFLEKIQFAKTAICPEESGLAKYLLADMSINPAACNISKDLL